MGIDGEVILRGENRVIATSPVPPDVVVVVPRGDKEQTDKRTKEVEEDKKETKKPE